MLKIKSAITSIVLALSFVFFGSTVVLAASDTQDSICTGASLSLEESASTECNESTKGSEKKINSLITDIVNILSVIVGIVAVIMIIWGGFKYITSGGDSGNVSAAKNVIIYAIVGLVIVALAQFIVKFVLSKI